MNSKLWRIKNRENDKQEKEKALLSLKQAALPVFEQNSRAKFQKCNKCTSAPQNYNITDEWLLEPVDVLKNRNAFPEIFTHKNLLAVMDALVVHPAAMKMIKYLQQESHENVLVFAMHSENYEINKKLIKYILDNFEYATSSNNAYLPRKPIFISKECDYKALMETYIKNEFHVFWVPVSIGCENPEPRKHLRYFEKCKFGLVKVTFHEPYQIEDFKQETDASFIYNHLFYDIIYKAPIMSTHLVAFLMLTHFRCGAKVEEIAMKIAEFQRNSIFYDFAFEGTPTDIAEYALKMLNDKLSTDNEGRILVRESTIPKLVSLAKSLMYQNLLKSLIITAALQLEDEFPFIDYNLLMKYSNEIYENAKRIFTIPTKPCTNLEDQLIDAFDSLVIEDILSRKTIVYTENEMRAQKMAKYFDEENDDDDDDDNDESSANDDLDPNNQVLINKNKQTEINVLRSVLELLIIGSDTLLKDDSDNE
jgi:hypothetical protein